MKVVIPMAGRGSRFSGRGYELPKPLLNIAEKPMVWWALQSLNKIQASEFLFIALQEHEDIFGISKILKQNIEQSFRIIFLNQVTEGQLCTVLAAKGQISSNEDLLIASSDTLVLSDVDVDIQNRAKDCRGMISVANMPGDRWSFARTGQDGTVVEVAEKRRISSHASTGLYYFSSGLEFVAVAEDMIRNQEKTRGEYYIIPVYQKYIQRGWRVDISIAREMRDMGTPESLKDFEAWVGAIKYPQQT